GAAPSKPRLERLDDPAPQTLAVLRLHGTRRREPMKGRPVERFVGVDVPDPRDSELVQEERLERRPPSRRQATQLVRGERVGERLDPEPRAEIAIELRVAEDHAVAESARVAEEEARPAFEPK